MKSKHDPRSIVRIIEKHKKHAEEAAKEFADAMKTGKELDIQSDDFDQGVQKTQSESGQCLSTFRQPNLTLQTKSPARTMGSLLPMSVGQKSVLIAT